MSVEPAVDDSAPPRASSRAPAAPARVRMPDFVRARRGARHSLDTALRALRRLGIEDARVVVESAGAGWERNSVVRQHPAPGSAVTSRTRIVLGVAGVGTLEALPYALRDVDESPFGVDPLMALFDNPIYKLHHHLRGGGEFYALRTADLVTARRWIEQVFQLNALLWAPARWPALARLLPTLHWAAGGERGLILALRVVCSLPVEAVHLSKALVPVPPQARFTLGVAAARLGVDTILGGGLAEAAQLEVTLGPVSVERYGVETGAAECAERRALYALVVPAHLANTVREHWVVGDPREPARLAAPATADVARHLLGPGAVLGLTTRLTPTTMPGGPPGRAT